MHKRTALDKEISRALKNTRNKVYRMRQAGASDDVLRRYDPRTNGSDTQQYYALFRQGNLTGSQKRAFLRRLKEFNATRVNARALVGEENYLPPSMVRRFNALQREVNRAANLHRQNIVKSAGGEKKAVYYNESYPQGRKLSEADEFDARHIWRELHDIHRQTRFPNKKILKRAITSLEVRLADLEGFDERLANWKQVAENKLRANNEIAKADAIRDMSVEQFRQMSVLTDFNAQMEVLQYPVNEPASTDEYKQALIENERARRRGQLEAPEDVVKYARGAIDRYISIYSRK
jgi:hypothetical protein